MKRIRHLQMAVHQVGIRLEVPLEVHRQRKGSRLASRKVSDLLVKVDQPEGRLVHLVLLVLLLTCQQESEEFVAQVLHVEVSPEVLVFLLDGLHVVVSCSSEVPVAVCPDSPLGHSSCCSRNEHRIPARPILREVRSPNWCEGIHL